MKAAELRTMSAEALDAKLKELKAELFNLRFQHAINQLDNPHKITEVKHDIARVMTVLQEMKKEEAVWLSAIKWTRPLSSQSRTTSSTRCTERS